jgi:hypothetical protein
MKTEKIFFTILVVLLAFNFSLAQKNPCATMTVSGLTTDACAGDFRTFQVITNICASQPTITTSDPSDAAGVISYVVNVGASTITWTVGLQVGYYNGPPHTTKTFLRTETMTFNYVCCDVPYSKTASINIYDCPNR